MAGEWPRPRFHCRASRRSGLTALPRILVADPLAEDGLDRLRRAGEVTVAGKLTEAELIERILDVDAATRKGILVVNAPRGNIVAAAEHTIALLFALARSVPQADASVKRGEWNRSKF